MKKKKKKKNVWTQNDLFNGLVTIIITSRTVVSEVVDNDNDPCAS